MGTENEEIENEELENEDLSEKKYKSVFGAYIDQKELEVRQNASGFACYLKIYYDALIKEGFSVKQAMDLTKILVSSSLGKVEKMEK